VNEITYSELSREDEPKLLKAISEVLEETNAHDKEGSEESSWNWQYKELPSAKSYIYIAKSLDRVIAYYHIPSYAVKLDDKELKLGHIQSVAVLKEFRGKGVFQKLAKFANKEIDKHLNIIYTFPNDKSIHTFTKYNNFSSIQSLPVYILPTNISNIVTSKYKPLGKLKAFWSLLDSCFRFLSKNLTVHESIEEFRMVSSEVEDFFSKFQAINRINLIRDRDFLQWRYLDSPKGKHRIFGLKEDGELKSVVILKTEKLFSVNGLLVMDFSYQKPKDLQKLLSNLITYKGKESLDDASFIFISAINEGVSKLKYSGFIPIPQRLSPRKLNFLTRETGKEKIEGFSQSNSWFISLGDWDVF
jgi:hypothetical protein